jgi:hypothetical protein
MTLCFIATREVLNYHCNVLLYSPVSKILVHPHVWGAMDSMTSTYGKSRTQTVVVSMTLDISKFRHPQSSTLHVA